MPLWTLLGLLEGKQTTPWPLAEGKDGQAGLLGMPRYHPELCAQGCEACADVCPTEAITPSREGRQRRRAPERRLRALRCLSALHRSMSDGGDVAVAGLGFRRKA